MKFKLFPFGAGVEQKESAQGKKYNMCHLSKSEKKQDGSWDTKYINFFDGDIGKAIAVLQRLQMAMIKKDEYVAKEEKTNKEALQEATKDIDSEIPF